MYTVTVLRGFIAQHYLTVPNPGPEGQIHSHRYEVELTFEGPALDEYDYLVDIGAVEGVLDDVESRYADTLLNDHPNFEGTNPSVERFARVVWDLVTNRLDTAPFESLTVRMWEDENAAAAYEDSV